MSPASKTVKHAFTVCLHGGFSDVDGLTRSRYLGFNKFRRTFRWSRVVHHVSQFGVTYLSPDCILRIQVEPNLSILTHAPYAALIQWTSASVWGPGIVSLSLSSTWWKAGGFWLGDDKEKSLHHYSWKSHLVGGQQSLQREEGVYIDFTILPGETVTFATIAQNSMDIHTCFFS